MCSKLQTIVCSYCLYPSFKRHEQLLHSLSQLLGILTMLQLPHEQHVCLFSTKVTMAPQLPFPTMVSISKSPKRTPSTSFGLSLTLTRLGMTTRLPPTGLARCFNLYRKVGSATTILENKDNIQDILFTLEMKGIVRTLAGGIYHLLK